MKKILILLVIIVLAPSFVVNAGGAGTSFGENTELPQNEQESVKSVDDNPDNIIIDDDGYYTQGSVIYHRLYYSDDVSSDYSYYKFTGDKLYAYRVNREDVGSGFYMIYVQNVESCLVYTGQYSGSGSLDISTVEPASFSRDNYEIGWGYPYNSTWGEEFIITCNIPVFDSSDPNYEENVRKYIEDGDVSGADNVDDIVPEPEYSDDVELPQNFKCVSGYKYILVGEEWGKRNLSKDLIYTWNQTVDTSSYSYDVDVSFVLSVYDADSKEYKMCSSSWINWDKNIPYSGSKNISMTLGHIRLNELINDYAQSTPYRPALPGARAIYFIEHVKVRVRNSCNNNCSNYVLSDVDIRHRTVSNSETDNSDTVVDDAEYDNDDGTKDSYDDDDVGDVSKITDFSAFIKWIKSGMGLGKSGLLGYIKEFYDTCIPFGSAFWGLIMLGFSVIILVGIVNFILKR